MGVDKPNYTQIPNLLLEDLMMHMSEAELKVTLAISRQTFGYHRERIKLSLTALQELTGLSRPTVVKGINEGMERGTITRQAHTDGSYVYALSINGETQLPSKDSLPVNKSNHQGSKHSLPKVVKNVDQPSKESLPEPVNNLYQNTPTLKKDIKERTTKKVKEKPRARTRSGFVHPNTKPILDAYVEALGYEPGNYGQESSAAKQLAKQGVEPIDVTAAYAYLKAQPFWQTKHLSLQTLVKEIPALKQAHLNGVPLTRAPTNGNGYMSKGEKQQAEVNKAFALLDEMEGVRH